MNARPDERGSTMIVAVGVLMITGIVATSVWAKTLGGLEQSSFEKERLDALASANSGLDEGTFRVEQIDLGSVPSNYTIVGSGETGSGRYLYRVRRTGTTSWELVATGVAADSMRSIRADISTSSRYRHAVATRQDIVLNGNPNQICSFRSGTTELDCPPNPADVRIFGSAGRISCSGNGWDQIGMTRYPPQGSADRQCGDTDNIEVAPSPLVLEAPQVPPGTQGLCGGPQANCTLDSARFATLGPGVYAVNNLTLGQGGGPNNLCSPANVNQDNPVVIYVAGSLTFANRVWLNADDGSANGQGCDNRPAVGPRVEGRYPTTQPGGFRVLQLCPGGGIVTPNGANQPTVSMILDAQCSSVTSNGGPHFYLFGAAVLNQFRDNGSLRVLAYDERLSLITTQRYTVTNWREIPPVANP